MRSKPQITYFDIRGRAECIRLLLEETGTEYEDLQITNAEWPEMKPKLPFAQLPVFRDGDVELVQSHAIVRHLARVHGLDGENEAQRVRCDVAGEAIRDADGHLGSVVWRPGFEKQRKHVVEKELPQWLGPLERFFRGNATPFWAGASLTFADIVAFDYLENTEALFPGALLATEHLAAFRDRFAERPNIAAYLQSSRRPLAIMYGPARGPEDDQAGPGPMQSSLRKIYPADARGPHFD
jgi:glutathione S-transferase